jgi:hypothetical protein
VDRCASRDVGPVGHSHTSEGRTDCLLSATPTVPPHRRIPIMSTSYRNDMTLENKSNSRVGPPRQE